LPVSRVVAVPSYLAYEPRHTTKALASNSSAGFDFARDCCFNLSRIAITTPLEITADCCGKASLFRSPRYYRAYQIEHTFPLIAIRRFSASRLFVASQVLRILAPEEISAALAHENAISQLATT